MFAAIETMIARAITTVTIKTASTVKATVIEKWMVILDRKMVPKKKLMPCIWMLATKKAVLAREALQPPPNTQGTPFPQHPTTAAGPGLVKTTTSPTKDGAASCRHARELTPTRKK